MYLYNSLYVMHKSRQSSSMLLQVRRGHLGGGVIGRGPEGTSGGGGSWSCCFLDQGAGCMGVFSTEYVSFVDS